MHQAIERGHSRRTQFRNTSVVYALGWVFSAGLFTACSGQLGDGLDAPGADSSSASVQGTVGSPFASGSGLASSANPATSGSGAPVVPAQSAAGSASAIPNDFVEPAAEAPELIARTWRLTHEQYKKSVVALIGVEPDVSLFVPDTVGEIYSNFSSTGFVRVDLASNYLSSARSLSQELPEAKLAALTTCNLTAACADAFIATMAERAFRRPPTPQELVPYRELFDLGANSGAADGDVILGFRAVLQGLLNSPLFLYRTEIGPVAAEQDSLVHLTDYEVASLVSYSLLDGPPTQALLDAAAAGSLTQVAGLAAAVQAELATGGASGQLEHFLSEWLEITRLSGTEKFEASFPGFADVRDAMSRETSSFLGASGTANGTISGLLLDAIPSVDPALDAFYRSDPSAPATSTRFGILSLGSVLSTHAKAYLTSPTIRGLFVRKRMLCQDINLPEGFTPPPLSQTEEKGIAKTTRELYEMHLSDASCSVCHQMMDNIGFSLESFDGAGRFRTLDTTQGGSYPIKTTAELTNSDVNRPIENPSDLAQALSESEMVRQCLAIQAFRFYFGQPEVGRGLPPITAGHRALREGGNLGDLLAGVLSTESTFARTRE